MDDERQGGHPAGTCVALGIFAYNEQRTITHTLDQLLGMQWGDLIVDAFILANGCSDRTVELARSHLSSMPAVPGLTIHVLETPTRGKSATWNYFVHDVSDRSAQVLVFADCDLEFGATDVIARLVRLLVFHPEAHCAVSLPTKLVDEHTTRFAHLANRGPATYDSKTSVSGQLYCLRAEFARRFNLPSGLPGEDGFVRAMVVTDLFTAKDNTARIVADDEIRHYFLPVQSLHEWYRHERRLLTGSTINYFVYQTLWQQVGSANGPSDAGEALRVLDATSSTWLSELVQQQAHSRRWLIPRAFMVRRFSEVDGSRVRLASMPKRITMTLLDWSAAVGANRLLRGDRGVGHW